MAQMIANMFMPVRLTRWAAVGSGSSAPSDIGNATSKFSVEDQLDFLEAQGETGLKIRITETGLFAVH